VASDKNQIKNVICENCDSEYQVKYKKHSVSSQPVHCAFCGEEIEEEQEDFEDDEQEDMDQQEDY